MIRVVLVDDQTLIRQGIRSLLELAGDVTIVAEAGDGDEAVAVIERERPDVVLLDLRMPRKNGVGVLRELQARGLPASVIVLTTFDDDEALLDAVKAGARGYFLKDVSLERLTAGIRDVAAGGSIIRPALTERVLRGLEHLPRSFDALDPPDPLTKREVEILRLMAGGYSNREIAEALGTAEGTVKNHASSILSKLGVRDRTRAVLKALELGYI
jgi:DNA-binding NarL/FixJ family response regulator